VTRWIWLDVTDVAAYHAEQISEHGGGAGLRDRGLLESALARPLNLAAYGKPTAFELAAAYAFGIAKNHPFVDGNKRAGLAVGLALLALNDVLITATDEELVELILNVTEGQRSKADVAVFMRSHMRK